jgi:hypothetical protein
MLNRVLAAGRRTQLKRDLERLGWTHRQLAEVLDLSERNIRRYISGELDIPKVVCLAVLWVRNNRYDPS